LLVALAVMAMLTLMAWRGVDAMGRAQETTRRISAQVQALQAGLIQWGIDLDAMVPAGPVTALDYDGRVLRITRQYLVDDALAALADPQASVGGGGLRVVAWGARMVDGRRQWLRWQSPMLRTVGQWEQAWQQAAWWGQNPDADPRGSEVAIVPVDRWELFYFRSNSWTSPLSSASEGGSAGQAQPPLPDGVRLVLHVAQGQSFSGRLRRDWVRPTLGPGGS
jgi:general secretion pathway protein J